MLSQAPHIVQLASEITATSSGLNAVKYYVRCMRVRRADTGISSPHMLLQEWGWGLPFIIVATARSLLVFGWSSDFITLD